MLHLLKNNAVRNSVLYKFIPFNEKLNSHLECVNWKTLTGSRYRSTDAKFEAVREPKPFQEIPGFKNYPIIGNLLSILRRKDMDITYSHIFISNLFKEFGPIMQMQFPFEPRMVFIYKPEDAKEMFLASAQNPEARRLSSLKKVRDQAVDNYFQKRGGLLTEDNEEWRRVRSRVQGTIMKPKNIVRYLPQMDQVTLEFIERISFFQAEYNEMPGNFLSEMYKWALESVSLVALNRRLGCLDPNLADDSMQVNLINATNDLFAAMHEAESTTKFWKLFKTPTFKKLAKAHDTFLKIADGCILETEKALNEKETANVDEELSLMETLLRKDGLTRKDVITLMLDLIFAGIDTTSHTLGFTLYCLAKNPKAQEILHKEIDSVLGDGKETISGTQLTNFIFLKLCVKEAQRLYPIAIGVTRVLQRDTVLSGYLVPKDTLIVSFHMISGWSKDYFDRPNEFLPERWDKNHPHGPINPYASLPFSHGARMCIGRRIAEQEIYTFLARVLHRYKVEYHYEDMAMKTRLITVPSQPLKFKFVERKK